MVTQPNISTTPSPAPPPEVPLSTQVLQQFFATMLKVRLLAAHHRQEVTIAEAIITGTLPNLDENDIVICAEPAQTLEALLPRIETNSREKSRLIPAESNVVAAIATGLACGLRLAGSSAVAVALLPGKATTGRFAEQLLHFAREFRDVPLVLIADWTASRQSYRDHHGHALSHWPAPTIAVDGRDVIAVYRVTKEAITAARRGHGPTLVDCVNFLAPGSRGRDNRDPLASFGGYLQRHNAWSDAWHEELQTRLKTELALSRKAAKAKKQRKAL